MAYLLWLIPLALIFWAVIHGGNLKQMPTVESTRCKDCAWFAPVDSNPTAQKIHDILDTGNEVGICRKLTYTEDRPVLTRHDGYCHRAERREADD